MSPSSTDLRSAAASFNALDWILAAILLWSAVTAFLRGLLREIFALVGLSLGILLAGLFYLQLSASLSAWIQSTPVREIVSFLAIAFGTMVVAGLLGRFLHRAAALIGLGFLDRLAGAAFGLLRGGLIGVALITAWTAFLPPDLALGKSRLAPYFLAGAHGVSFVVPQHLQQQIVLGVDRIRNADQAR